MMTTAEFMNTEAASVEPVRMTESGRMVIRGAQRLIGAALALAAVGLWIVPGSSWESDVMLFKLILSLVALFAAVGLLQASASSTSPEVEIDTIRREVRLMRPASDGSAAMVERCAFAELSRAERDGDLVQLWGRGNRLLANVKLSDRAALASLVAGLRDVGKLA
jgi:hypothetical protein